MEATVPVIAGMFDELVLKHPSIDFMGIYTIQGGIESMVNATKNNLDIEALGLLCLDLVNGDNRTTELMLEYTDGHVLAFYSFQGFFWLIVSADKKSFPLVNYEVKKLSKQDITADFTSDQESSVSPKMLAAKRLQESALPDLNVLTKYFDKYFSYYSPEDTLSGDFYWVRETEEKVFIVVGDCTGHSIEGALASMTLYSILNQKVSTDIDKSMSDIFEELRKYEASSGSSGYSIGVDLALCYYDKRLGTMDVSTSGVPVLYMDREKYSSLIKPKRSISLSLSNVEIQQQRLNLNKGDRIIIYTDGLPDQFDQDDKKKLGNNGVRKMFESMNGTFTGDYFEEKLNTWRGTNKQLDDITVLGFEV